MKRIVVYFLIVSLCAFSCAKELGINVSQEQQPQIAATITPDSAMTDGDQDNQTDEIAGAEENLHDIYSFMGVSGVYFGCSSTFKTKGETLQFILGTNLTTNLAFTKHEFEELIQPGIREYGSLGAFTTYPARKSGKVEIAFTDKHGRQWCSTRITEQHTGDGIETMVNAEQPKGEFVIEDAHKFEIAAETEGYRLTGHFSCTLYEVNGNAKKKIKGDFTAVVAPQ